MVLTIIKGKSDAFYHKLRETDENFSLATCVGTRSNRQLGRSENL
jgi:hypothetical protein